MNFKQFLKPERRKIMTTIIITLLFIGYWLYVWFSGHGCTLWTGPLEKLCEPLYSLPWEGSCPPYHCGKPDFLTSIAIEIYFPLFYLWILISISVIPYIISCLIVWIYDKVKKKK
jgi:hypothetical protein